MTLVGLINPGVQMFIKLKIIAESEKAYQLKRRVWVPKSVLSSEGLKLPYFEIKKWWLDIQMENAYLRLSELLDLGRKIKPTENDRKNSIRVMQDLYDMSLNWRDLPEDVKEYWDKYWNEMYSNNRSSYYEMEPRLWGNGCFEGEMSSWH